MLTGEQGGRILARPWKALDTSTATVFRWRWGWAYEASSDSFVDLTLAGEAARVYITDMNSRISERREKTAK